MKVPAKVAKTYILCWYRPPIIFHNDSKSFEGLAKLVKTLQQEGEDYYCYYYWETNCDLKKPKGSHTLRLKLLYSKFQFSQLMRENRIVASKANIEGHSQITQSHNG